MPATPNERAAAVAIFLPVGRVLPQPDGGVVEADRYQVAYSYPGLADTAEAVGLSGATPRYRTARHAY